MNLLKIAIIRIFAVIILLILFPILIVNFLVGQISQIFHDITVYVHRIGYKFNHLDSFIVETLIIIISFPFIIFRIICDGICNFLWYIEDILESKVDLLDSYENSLRD